MAGVKGRSGGPRKNAGGARPGAGRKPKVDKESANQSSVKTELERQPHGGALKREKAVPVPMGDRDMLQLLQDVALGLVEATPIQVRAAIAAVQYTHIKKGDGGKKEEAQDKAKQAAGGKFAAAAPPKSVMNNVH